MPRPGPEVRRTAWRKLAAQIGADFLAQRHQRPDTVQLRHADCTITLDSIDGSGSTRMRAPFINLSDFKFLIYNAGLLTVLGKKLVRLQDLDIGHPGIDRRFVVQSARPDAVRDLFRNERVRDLVWSQASKIRLGISEDDGLLGGTYPPEVDLLHFQAPRPIVDIERLKGLFELFKAILDDVSVPKGEEDDVEFQIRRLQAPGGIITGRVTLWEGGPPRHDAVDELTRLGDARAVNVLLATLHDSDPVLQAKAAAALGDIGDERAIPALIRLLGRRQGPLKRKLCEDAADALVALGQEDTVYAFAGALEGRSDGLPAVAKKYRPDVIEGLMTSLEGPGRLAVANTVAALQRIGAVEALPELRQRISDYMLASVRESFRQAIEALEARTNLPRPAGATEPRADTLPRPADGATKPPTDTLPKATDL